MASAPSSAARVNGRAHKSFSAACVTGEDKTNKRRPSHRTLPSALKADPEPVSAFSAAPSPDRSSLPIDDQLDRLWIQLQSQMLTLLAHGVAAPFQQRAFDKLDFSMKQYAKLRRERAEELRIAKPDEPNAEELAAILNKMDMRIDALAEERFKKKLAQRELHAPAADGRRAGMDV
jgi:hypothetical protein